MVVVSWPTYVSDGQQSSVKEHHHAHQHEEQSKGGQAYANLYNRGENEQGMKLEQEVPHSILFP